MNSGKAINYNSNY